MTKIALLCPTRGRPEQCRRMVESAYNTSASSLHVGLYLADTDVAKPYQEKPWHNCVKMFTGPDFPTVMKWNWLAEQYKDCDLFMLAADDIEFMNKGWDAKIIEHYEGLTNKIHCYALQDSRDKDGTPHFFVTREWIDAMGYAFIPIFNHFFVDTWTVAIAKANDVFTHLRDYLLVHDKSNDKGTPDQTHLRIRENGTHDRDKYVNDTCGHFLDVEKSRLKLALLGYKAKWSIEPNDKTRWPA